MTYIAAADLKFQLGIETADTSFDPELERAAAGSDEAIDALCNRTFNLDGEDVERRYRIEATDLVEIDDLATPDTVSIDGVELTEDTDYTLEPLNAVLDGRPYTHIRLTRVTSGMMAVEGKFGWPAVPARVIEASALLAPRLFKRREAPFGVVSFGEAQPVKIELSDPDIALMLLKLIRNSAQSVPLG